MTGTVAAAQSNLFSLYFHELGWLSSEIQKHCEAIFKDTPDPKEGYYIKVSPELHAHIVSVLVNAANLKKLVYTGEKRYKNESMEVFRLRQKRSRLLREALADLKLEEILNNKVRNSLEHFDEYLDENIVRLSKKPPSTFAAYNMALSHREVFNPQVYPIRLYIVSEQKFYNMRSSIDIGRIYAEASSILERLRELGAIPHGGPGGVMIPLTDANHEDGPTPE
ncbi:MAG: hypothetical protein AB1500_11470 [Bacillota bacterium]